MRAHSSFTSIGAGLTVSPLMELTSNLPIIKTSFDNFDEENPK